MNIVKANNKPYSGVFSILGISLNSFGCCGLRWWGN